MGPREASYNYDSIHRHHKRTPYASNTFPKESYSWECSDQGLFYYGEPRHPTGNASASTYWSVFTNPINPFAQSGFNGTCQFPQITRQGLDDSWQHGADLYSVYHDLLGFIPDNLSNKVIYRVSNNVITSQVAGMVIQAMYAPASDVPLHIQPSGTDSLEPSYPCPAASSLYSSYGVGSSATNWTAHLNATKPLFDALDASLQASAASYGVFLAELADHIRSAVAGKSAVLYRHNVAHDGSLARLLSILQVEQMVWVGMGSEVVFEIYKNAHGKHFIRILWGGQVLRSSSPSLGANDGAVDMLDLDVFLAYVDGLVGYRASKIVGLCASVK
ncbi:histidine acid phosphatase [Pyrenophora seminiperda CCB06]|uniref:Histidine acid phosphatase n=1 Tax=Pyrenophora seminiperda CCB06 TaxID=1302712 RepID=A0A3M7MCP6_9PLEO|nr:histidine acid phosphatase [Pyrenophora seminiperda CCB06]